MKAKKLIIMLILTNMLLLSSIFANANRIEDKKTNDAVDLSIDICDVPDDEFEEGMSSSARLYGYPYEDDDIVAASSLGIHYYGLEYIDWGPNSGYWLYKFRLVALFADAGGRPPESTMFLKNMKIIVDPIQGIRSSSLTAPNKGGWNFPFDDYEEPEMDWSALTTYVCTRAIYAINPYVGYSVTAVMLAASMLQDSNHDPDERTYEWHIPSNKQKPTEAAAYLDFGFFVDPNTNWEIEFNLEVNCVHGYNVDHKFRLDYDLSRAEGDGKIKLKNHRSPPVPSSKVELGQPWIDLTSFGLDPFYLNEIPFSIIPENPAEGIVISLSSGSISIPIDKPNDVWYGQYSYDADFPFFRTGPDKLNVQTSNNNYLSRQIFLLDLKQ